MSTIVVSGSTPAEVSVTIPQVNSISVTPPEVRSVSVSANVPSNARLIPAGGAEGVILRKDSVADYDVEWTTYSFPLADGDDGQVLTTDGAGTISFSYPKTIAEEVKNVSGGTLTKGTPVHVTGNAGNQAEVIAADTATHYPAHFVLDQDLADGASGLGIALGFINNVDVAPGHGINPGDTIYLKPGGGFTNVKPTGTNAIQNLGVALKVNNNPTPNKISGIIMGAGRANDIPNIATGNIWAGNADGVATATSVAYIDIANERVGIGTTSPAQKLDVNGIALTKGVRAESTTDYSLITRDSGGNTVLYVQSANSNINQPIAKFNYGSTTANSGTTVLSVGKDTSYFNATAVGIGTTTPTATLEVSNTTAPTLTLRNPSANPANAGTIKFIESTNTDGFKLTYDGSDNKLKLISDSSGVESTRMVVQRSDGNVGIGTTSPSQKAVISGPNTAPTLNGATVSSASLLVSNSDTYYGTYFATLGSGVGLIQQRRQVEEIYYGLALNPYGGNVGIGTTSPSQKLDVSGGDINLSLGNYIRFGGQLGIKKVNLGAMHFYAGTNSTTGGFDFATWNGSSYSEGAFVIRNSGNVGIGTTGPAKKLHVLNSTNEAQIRLGQSGSGSYDIGVYSGDTFSIGRDADTREFTLSNGNVGIGTTSPLQKLHLKDGTDVNLQIGAVSSELQLKATNDADSAYIPMILRASEFNILSGNVGIGTTSPAYKVDVNGDVNIPFGTSNGYRINGNRILSQGSGFFEFGVLDYKSIYPNISTNNDGTFRIQSNGSTLVTVNQSGNVGIGTTSPNAKLDVAGDTDTTTILGRAKFASHVTDYLYLSHFDRSSSTDYALKQSPLGSTALNAASGQNVTLNINNSPVVAVIGATSNVGIGTGSPSKKLHVSGGDALIQNATASNTFLDVKGTSSNAYIRAYSDSNSVWLYQGGNSSYLQAQSGSTMRVGSGTGNLIFSDTSGEVMRTSSGNVGIGTASPASRLQVNGSTSDSSANAVVVRDSLSASLFSVRNDGRVDIPNGVLYTTEGISSDGPIDSSDATNTSITSETARFNKFGLMTNRSSLYITNYNASGSMQFGVGGVHAANTKMYLSSAGRLGIGTLTPSAKLDVAGLVNINDGSNNVMISSNNTAMAASSGSNNTAVGYQAGLSNTSGNYNAFFGRYAGYYNTSGGSNSFIGVGAGQNNTIGNSNSFVGVNAGYSNTFGGDNSFVGVSAGFSNTSGSYNSFVGRNAGQNNTIGNTNSFFGRNTGYYSTGSANVLIGYEAGYGAATSTFSNTVAVGYQALYDLTSGAGNTAVGYQASTNINSGANNTTVGYQAGYTNTTGIRNIFIGYQAGYNETGSDKLYINNSSGSNPLIYGDFNLRAATINGDLNVSSGNLRADAVEINGRSQTSPAAGEYGAGSKIVTQFATGTVTAGVVYVASSGAWVQGDADVGSASIGMIAVATDSASANSMLIEGVIKLSSNAGFSGASAGDVLYLSNTAGELTTTAPSGTGDYVRVCGYVVNALQHEVFFSPSKEWRVV